jgi:oleandomycin transport system permease protein
MSAAGTGRPAATAADGGTGGGARTAPGHRTDNGTGSGGYGNGDGGMNASGGTAGAATAAGTATDGTRVRGTGGGDPAGAAGSVPPAARKPLERGPDGPAARDGGAPGHGSPVALETGRARSSDEGRIGPRAHARHIGALVRRNLLQIKKDPESMADALLMPVILILLFVYVFGGAISGEGNRDAYVNYVVPGMMAMMGMNIALGVGVGISDDTKKGVMDRFRSMPIARSSVLIAKIAVEIGRMVVATSILLGMGLLLGLEIKTSFAHLLGAVALSLAFGFALTWIFILMGLTLPTAQAIQGLGMLVMMPLQFGSSIFAPPTTMPSWLETFTEYNPLSSLADASRALINGGGIAGPVAATLAWAVAITAVTAPLAVARFRRSD